VDTNWLVVATGSEEDKDREEKLDQRRGSQRRGASSSSVMFDPLMLSLCVKEEAMVKSSYSAMMA
jgi:hypothetical protein